MQKPLSFDQLQQDMPTALAKIIAKARESKSRRFDASTEPSTWAWSVDWAEREPVAVDGEDPQDAAKRWDDLRAEGAEPYVRERIRSKAMLPSLRLKTGPTAIVEPLLADGELPSEWVDTFALKTYEPLLWNNATITLYQPNHTERPGLADAAVFAGYATATGGVVILMAEGHQDREFNTLWSVELDNARKTATVTGVVPRLDGEWEVPVGTTITVNDEKWRRLDQQEVERTIKAGPWGRIDARAAREAQILLGLAGLSVPNRPLVSADPSNIPDGTPYWPVGAARSDAEVLRDKWTPVAAKAVATVTAEATATPALPKERKKPTTVAGSVKANDPDALREAFEASTTNGLQLSGEQLSALLLTAASKASPEIMGILMDHGANPGYKSNQGMTLASTVVRDENVANLQWLHAQNLVDLEEADGNGNTLLMLAVESHKFVGAQALLDLGANVNGANMYDHTALHQAASTGNGPAVQWLIEHQVDPNHENFQRTIAEEMVPDELPEMVDVLADYRFAVDKGEAYTLPANFLESLRNNSQHPSMQKEGGDPAAGMDLGGGIGVQVSGLEGVTMMSGDDFQRVIEQHGVDGLVAAGQNGTLGAILGEAGAGILPPGEHQLPLRRAGGEPVNPSDYLFEHIGYGRILDRLDGHMVVITPKALWDAEGVMDDQPHDELLRVLPESWNPEDVNDGGSWVFQTSETPEQVIARLKQLGFGQNRVFSAMARAMTDAPEPLDPNAGDEPSSPEPDAPAPRRPRMR